MSQPLSFTKVIMGEILIVAVVLAVWAMILFGDRTLPSVLRNNLSFECVFDLVQSEPSQSWLWFQVVSR
jgi:hypothetical protein